MALSIWTKIANYFHTTGVWTYYARKNEGSKPTWGVFYGTEEQLDAHIERRLDKDEQRQPEAGFPHRFAKNVSEYLERLRPYRYRDVWKWGEDRDLYRESNFQAQFEKLLSEYQELSVNVRKDHVTGIPDDIGDNYVVLMHLIRMADIDIDATDSTLDLSIGGTTENLLRIYSKINSKPHKAENYSDAINCLRNMAVSYGYTLPTCVDAALAEIWDRKGRFVDEKFVKDVPAQGEN